MSYNIAEYVMDFSAATQISRTVSSGFFHLRQIKAIRRCLPTNAAKSLINALVVLRLDYCNSIYAGLPRAQLDRLQSVFNATARLIFGVVRSAHVTPLLRDRLHWFRAPERVTFKLCVMVFKALHGSAPGYITQMCVPVVMTNRRATLRSSSISATASTAGRLTEPKRSTKTLYGERAFAVAGPAVWNSLPADLRLTNYFHSFKKQLKTHRFYISYNISTLEAFFSCYGAI